MVYCLTRIRYSHYNITNHNIVKKKNTVHGGATDSLSSPATTLGAFYPESIKNLVTV